MNNMKKINLLFFPSILPLLISCSSEEIENNDIEINTIKVHCQQIESLDETRSNLGYVNGELTFSWAEGDVLGICPNVGDQLSFKIGSESIGGSQAVFDGGGWKTKPSSTYTAYYPLNREVYLSGNYSEIPLSYVGKIQSKNNSTVHLGAYDYMVSQPQTVSQSGTVNFELLRISSVLTFYLTMPESITTTQLKLTCQEMPFITKGTFDARSGSIAVTPVETSNEMTLYLDNIVTDSNNKLTANMLICPSDFTGKQWILSVLTNISEGKYYEYKISIPVGNLTANKHIVVTRPREGRNEAFEKVEHPASDYPYPPKDGGITGTVPDFDVVEVN